MKKTVIEAKADRLFLLGGIIDALFNLSSAASPYEQPFCNIWIYRKYKRTTEISLSDELKEIAGFGSFDNLKADIVAKILKDNICEIIARRNLIPVKISDDQTLIRPPFVVEPSEQWILVENWLEQKMSWFDREADSIAQMIYAAKKQIPELADYRMEMPDLIVNGIRLLIYGD